MFGVRSSFFPVVRGAIERDDVERISINDHPMDKQTARENNRSLKSSFFSLLLEMTHGVSSGLPD